MRRFELTVKRNFTHIYVKNKYILIGKKGIIQGRNLQSLPRIVVLLRGKVYSKYGRKRHQVGTTLQ